MPFEFPAAPAVDEIYTLNGVTYRWDGEVWRAGDAALVPTAYVLKAGDTMTGTLSLVDPDPSVPLHATHKKYVDRLISEMSLYQGTWQVAANVPNLNIPPNAPLNGYSWTAQTADPNIPEMAPLTIPGIGGRTIAALDTIKFSSALNPPTGEYEHIQGPVNVSQMTIADTPPAGGFHGQQWWDSDAGKNYVFYIDPNGDGYWVQTSGGGGSAMAEAPDDGAMYGRQAPTAGGIPAWAAIVTSATIIGDTAPATPGNGQLWWNTIDGTLNIWDGAQWVQANVEEAPVDGQSYARMDAAWAVTSSAGGNYLPLTGGTVSGNLNVAPAASLCLEINNGDVSAIVVEAKVSGASTQCDIRATQNNSAQPSGVWEFWTANGMYGGPAWAFKTTIAAPPGIDVNGIVAAASLADRSLLADPELAQFVCGEGDSRGVDLGRVVKYLLAEIKALKAAR